MLYTNNGKTTAHRYCSECGKIHYMELTLEQGEKAKKIGQELIQVLFPELTPMEREFLKSGQCPECQAHIWGEGEHSDKIHAI